MRSENLPFDLFLHEGDSCIFDFVFPDEAGEGGVDGVGVGVGNAELEGKFRVDVHVNN